MPDMTIVYYTSNADYQHLEENIREMIVRNSCGLPIISVSHHPIDFGRNIVVGDIGRSTENIFTQLRMGAEHAKTKYIAVCEADFLVSEKKQYSNVLLWNSNMPREQSQDLGAIHADTKQSTNVT